MQFGEGFIKAIEAIYKIQQSIIKVNNELTKNFKIEKGTRQGFPLSPLLFLMVLEVLLREVKEDKEIKVMKIRGFFLEVWSICRQ